VIVRAVLGAAAVVLAAACSSAEPAGADLDALRAPPEGSRALGVFEGKTPCADCERVKVRLTLFEDIRTRTPTEYVLERIYVGNGDDRTVSEGTWRTTTGAPTDAEAIVVDLRSTAPPEFRRFQRVGDDILLILGQDDQPRVGNAEHSFALSRTMTP
jgi:hypothetical protein